MRDKLLNISRLSLLVPRTGLEPARLSPLAPETSASTIPPPGLVCGCKVNKNITNSQIQFYIVGQGMPSDLWDRRDTDFKSYRYRELIEILLEKPRQIGRLLYRRKHRRVRCKVFLRCRSSHSRNPICLSANGVSRDHTL